MAGGSIASGFLGLAPGHQVLTPMHGSAFATADVVVVGAGSAGCLAAERLSRDSDRQVLLLDAGPAAFPEWEQTRLDRLPISPGAPRTVRFPELRGRDVVRGGGLGGSSTINGGYFLRGHRHDYDSWPYPQARIDAVLDELDGGDAGGGAMSVSAFDDAELGSVASAFDAYWRRRGPASDGGAWPIIGLNRVRSNRADGGRFTAADAFLAEPRPNRRVIGGAAVTEIVVRGGRASGVQTARGRVDAGTVVLAAGTLGSAALVLPIIGGELTVFEHAERLVRFRPRREVTAPALLQTVLHTENRLEIRCYGNDFAAFIDGVPAAGIPIGVADMGTGVVGTLRWDGALQVDLGEPDAASYTRIDAGVGIVEAMLAAPDFADLVEPGSVTVDPTFGLSSHAWGALATAPRIDGLTVVDGSVLASPLRSGPHLSVMAGAALIVEQL
ncbi:mycofactocin system GMC family oxidoreductase MftG [Gordonia sp. (in: high G+C Gram-positive bacteria)]|uniref:mycofactocin system GMC family oxidoreductase MftG n=1 Tax=Gordonia sp. (in: high G+C Gram-positive bacteria) TaxID=84139 RepID=UPI003C7336E4